ncbi:MAG: hypothetical protein SPM02_03095 [Bacteroidales bacterium]|nr:hypothetical protein [Bacteroidales bacterium]
MESIKSYLVDGGGSANNDLAAILAANNNNNNMWNNPLWAIVFLAALGNGNLLGGNGNRNGNANVDFVSSQLGAAIAGNANAISNLSTQLNCSESQIQSALNSMMNSVNSLANNLGMSVNALENQISQGNMTLANQLCNCCCEMRETVTKQGYEGQIRSLELANAMQNQLGGIRQAISDMGKDDTLAICQQTNELKTNNNDNTRSILAKLDAMTTQALQDKLDAARAETTQVRGELSQLNQNQYFAGMLGQALAPINAQLAAMGREVEAIKQCQPNTISVPYPNVQVVSTTPWMGQYVGSVGQGSGFFG